MEGTDIVRVIDGNNGDICATAEISVTTPPPTIIIDGCDTGVMDRKIEEDHTMSYLIGECANNADGKHGKFVSCVSKLTNKWKKIV